MSKRNLEIIKQKKLNHTKEKAPQNKNNTKKWSLEEDRILSNLIINHKYKSWKLISTQLPGRSPIQCQYRWTKNLKPGLVKGPWSVQEDKLLIEWVNKNGPRKWNQCCEYIHGRSGKQCREHWNNCLNPGLVKGEWTAEEDFLIMHFYQKYNGSWKKIVNLFNGRTENSIKNRFFSQLRKIAASNLSSEEKRFTSKIKLDDLKNYLQVAISNSKEKYLKEKALTDEELNNFVNKMDQKIKLKIKKKTSNSTQGEENDNNETCFSTNLMSLESSQNFIKKDTNTSLINKKRKRSNGKELQDDLCSIEEEDENENAKMNDKKQFEENDNSNSDNSDISDNNDNNNNCNNSNNLNNINNKEVENNNENIVNKGVVNNDKNQIINNNINKNNIANNNNNIIIKNIITNNNIIINNNNNNNQDNNNIIKSDNLEEKTQINSLKNDTNNNNNYNGYFFNNNNDNINQKLNNIEINKINENNSKNNSNSNQSKSEISSINIINLFDPRQKNFSLFDNYKFHTNYPFQFGNLIFNHVDSLTDLQARLSSNTFNFTTKPSTTSFNGNQVIDNDNILNKNNSYKINSVFK